jgi:hypothetical protein
MKFKSIIRKNRLHIFVLFGYILLSFILIYPQNINPLVEEEQSLGLKLYYRSLQPGDVILIQFPNSPGIKEVKGTLFGCKLSFWKQGDIFYSLMGIALTTRPGEYFLKLNIEYENGLIFEKKYKLTVIDKQFGIQHLTVDPRYIHLSREDLIRVQQERILLKKVYNNSNGKKLWNGSFIEPLNSEISSPFGLRRFFNKQPRGRHSGVDLRAAMGTPIKGSNSGLVVLARDLFFAGNCVIIDHGLDIFSIYCHLSKISVQEGEIVEKGQIIGFAGATGRVTGPHLHWSIKIGGVNIAPFSLLYLKME